MKTIRASLYDHPQYYDLLFGSDWKAEFQFLLQCFEQQRPRREVKRVFEPACGTGRLLFRLARQGYEVAGLDINPKAVAYCNLRFARHGLPPTARLGDMSDFRLPRKADAAFNTISSFRHLPTEKAAQGHLRCVARALAKGGLYILGLHLTPTVGRPMDEERWAARRGHLGVTTRLRTLQRDMRRRRERFRMTCDIHTPTRSFRLVEDVVFRIYTARQFRRLLAGVSELEVVGVYDFGYRMDQPLDVGPETEDAVYVLRKR